MPNEPTTNSALYGKGVFTTIAIRGGEPFLWEKHWRRLMRDAGKLGIDLAEHSEESTRKSLEEQSIAEGRARITFFDGSPSELWGGGVEKRTRLSIIAAQPREITQPFRLTISPYPINSQSPLAGVKSCNYLENILAKDEAAARGFHEAVRINEFGHVAGGCLVNIFWMRDGELFTPSLSTGCLAGTTREYILENLICEEGEFEISDLKTADDVFLTSAGIGVAAAGEIDGRGLSGDDHPVLSVLPR